MGQGINSRHRKHYKAGSVWKPGEQEANEAAAESWAKRVTEYMRLAKEKLFKSAADVLQPGDIKGFRRTDGKKIRRNSV